MPALNKTIQITTDTATLAIFDYNQLDSHINEECDWWAQDFSDITEVKTGKVAFIGLGADGIYDVRVTTNDLTKEEKAFATEVLNQAGIEISSGAFMVTAGEGIPGGGFKEENDEHTCKLPQGAYNLKVYALDSLKAQTLGYQIADYVVVIEPRNGIFKELTEEPRFECSSEYLYDSTLRAVPAPAVEKQITSSDTIKAPNSFLTMVKKIFKIAREWS